MKICRLNSREAVDSVLEGTTNRAEAGFVKPKKATSLSRIILVKSIEKRKAVELQNRYSSLSESETDEENKDIVQKNKKNVNPRQLS